MATVFTTGMQGPKAVEQLNELWDVASNAAEGIVNISTDPDNAIALHVQACFSAERKHHEDIDSASFEALQSYSIGTDWPSLNQEK